MFGSKREKALEEELAAVRRESERRGKLLSEIADRKDEIAEQFARLTASYAQVEKNIGQLREQMQELHGLAEDGAAAAQDVRNAIVEMNNGVNTFEVNHSVFVGEIRKQEEKIEEIVESNKHFTTPMKYISEFPAIWREAQGKWQESVGRMGELSRDMSVLMLNAAIEAGRMGETGREFVTAAEQVRAFAEGYEREANGLLEQFGAEEGRLAELEEQTQHLNGFLKENNISMGKLYRDAAQGLASYEAQQKELREFVTDGCVGKADALQQGQEECARAQERMLECMDELEAEIKEYKNGTDDLEALQKSLQRLAEKIK